MKNVRFAGADLNRIALGALLVLAGSYASAQSVLIDFNSASSITDNLNKGTLATAEGGQVVYGTTGDLSVSASGGLGGSSGGQVPANPNDIFIYGTKQSFTSNFITATTSSYVKIKNGQLSGVGLALTMGFASLSAPESGNGTINGTWTGSSTGVPRPRTIAGVNQYALSVTLRETTGTPDSWAFALSNNGTNSTPTAGVTLTSGNWYFWETVYTNSGDGTILVTANLFASDDNGVILGESLLSLSQSVSNDSLLQNDIYGFVSSQNGFRRGIDQLDNLSYNVVAVPEAGHVAVALGLAALAGAWFKRRSRVRA